MRFRMAQTGGGGMSEGIKECKFQYDEICCNPICPMCADFCPEMYDPGVCRYEDRTEGETCEK